jgi:hypothetical protein
MTNEKTHAKALRGKDAKEEKLQGILCVFAFFAPLRELLKVK